MCAESTSSLNFSCLMNLAQKSSVPEIDTKAIIAHGHFETELLSSFHSNKCPNSLPLFYSRGCQ